MFVLILLTFGAVSCVDPVVWTRNGFVKGENDGNLFSFVGIPYAEVDPHNPFGDSLDVSLFQGAYSAKNDKAVCPQQDDVNLKIVGTLDCLRINVYVPVATPQTLLPVMIFFHGGDFKSWSSNRDTYGPDFLVSKGVILVTFNYRLGPYGFMSIHRADIPGNAGLRDQLKALEWVKDNISAFGGDEDNITVFGEGAGAASIEFHIISNYSKRLFQKAILQSGSVLCDWAITEPDIEAPLKLVKYMGIKTNDIDVALNHLYYADPSVIIKASVESGLIESFKPVIEKEFPKVQAMIKDKPSDLLDKAALAMPMIIGFNSKEGHHTMRNYASSPDEYLNAANFTIRNKLKKYFNFDDDDLDEAERLVKFFYLVDKKIGPNTVDKIFDFESDFSFVYPILRDSRYYIEAGASVFLYTFDYAGHRNYMKLRHWLYMGTGAMHGDEIGYLFKQAHGNQTDTYADKVIVDVLTRMWTDFAKTSNPTPASMLFPFTWMPATEDLSYALLNDRLQMIQHPFYSKMAFWDRFFDVYGSHAKW